jgi:hypothetical protein
MQSEPICPHCGESFGESIPLAIQDPINILCPVCGMNYVYYRSESEALEQEPYYFSTGLRRRHPLQKGSRDTPDQSIVMTRSCLLGLCCVGALLLFGMLLIIEAILRLFGFGF